MQLPDKVSPLYCCTRYYKMWETNDSEYENETIWRKWLITTRSHKFTQITLFFHQLFYDLKSGICWGFMQESLKVHWNKVLGPIIINGPPFMIHTLCPQIFKKYYFHFFQGLYRTGAEWWEHEKERENEMLNRHFTLDWQHQGYCSEPLGSDTWDASFTHWG